MPKILILPALLVLLMPPLIQAQEDLSGDKSEESDAFESGQASEELSGEASGEPSGQVSGELGWEPSGQSMGQSSLPEESSGSGFDPSYEID
ncbi:chondroitin proteoglycan 3-like isoform X2 [Mauremys reevesii]|nr:chondroitin proteoglycan 3-like isoform X2 [Mauremys reevesii]XP_039375888.1 chondroitin proteoglycan 3-like isoform X2 [Mauremys reevesii]XP_039375889.1 chondroitin proteoglycan 3-like isoform X2 [Mauremys reevesii]XP_039375890.1 chondroitin proteoglycan 3-like isoform X2 [Mauremys reevesii]XP_039375891.1 chondroitin proteoglycan 3-like isoform X2 [Mauremys reevesii]XP_039375892.1 chondroitin proteoglycan 3-like isoform X2 [Mauremys reevesii]XP_039375893.1 chondroitin proteoglycan 3-like 